MTELQTEIQTEIQLRDAIAKKLKLMHVRVNDDFGFHPATTAEKRLEHTSVRMHCRDLAHFIVDNVPAGREQSQALTHLEAAMHWANAGIAKAGPVLS